MRLFGYAHVSTCQQSLDNQVKKLRAERERILERTNEGRIAARNRSVKFGRKQSVNQRQVLKLYQSRIGATTIAQRLNIGRSTVYKILQEDDRSQTKYAIS